MIGNVDYWLFGDTFLTGAIPFVNAAAARSTDFDAGDCIDLEFRQISGRAAPLIPIAQGETTVWPEGVISLSPGRAHFYYSSATRDTPTQWHVNAVGVGIFDERMEGSRLGDLWARNTELGSQVLGARSPILLDGFLYVFLYTTDNRHLLARVLPPGITDSEQYEYWNGTEFTHDQADAVTLWREPDAGLPAHNGLSVRFNDYFGRWVALSTSEFGSVEVRTSDDLWGPWSEPQQLFDCGDFFEGEWPVCYSAEYHDEFSRRGDRTLYITLNSRVPYEVWLFEIELNDATE